MILVEGTRIASFSRARTSLDLAGGVSRGVRIAHQSGPRVSHRVFCGGIAREVKISKRLL